MKCPACKETIDDDSLFCDQCGSEILVCSKCGRPGKGKRCIFDGQPMEKPGRGAVPAPASDVAPPPPPTSTPDRPTSPAPELSLRSAAHGVEVALADGDVVGRVNGPHASIFGRFNQISSTHLKFQKIGNGWAVVDLGSTNGTFLGGTRLAPQAPCPMSDGDVLRIADVDFVVSLAGATTATGTRRI